MLLQKNKNKNSECKQFGSCPLFSLLLYAQMEILQMSASLPIFSLYYAEVRIHDAWSVGSGENSKDVEVQRNRIRREKETIYRTSQEIPSDPKEPWDREMEYDDSLTPEIPTEQLPDGDGVETVVSPREQEINNNGVSAAPGSTQNGTLNMVAPDLELLAVLMKNPELVFALTSGQDVGSLSSQETVKLLDMIKANGDVAASLGGSLSDGLGGSSRNNAEANVPVSLPSPTPSSDHVTVRLFMHMLYTFFEKLWTCINPLSSSLNLELPRINEQNVRNHFFFF